MKTTFSTGVYSENNQNISQTLCAQSKPYSRKKKTIIFLFLLYKINKLYLTQYYYYYLYYWTLKTSDFGDICARLCDNIRIHKS